jgi:hypothetical protein
MRRAPNIQIENKWVMLQLPTRRFPMLPIRHFTILSLVVISITLGCQTKHEIEVKPIEIKPMEVTLNINLNIKMVNEDLNSLFGES